MVSLVNVECCHWPTCLFDARLRRLRLDQAMPQQCGELLGLQGLETLEIDVLGPHGPDLFEGTYPLLPKQSEIL